MAEYLSILVIEDVQDVDFNLTTVLKRLESSHITLKLFSCSDLVDTLKTLNEQEIDIIFINICDNTSHSLEALIEIQKRAISPPIIVVGKTHQEDLERETIKLGAQDYLSSTELNAEFLIRIIHNSIERHHLRENLKALSFTDELTGIYNRRGFMTLLEQQIALAKRMKKGFYLLMVDLDYLKHINDTYGHLAGDKALMEIASCLRSAFRRHDIVGRLGGDEFAIIAIHADSSSGDRLVMNLIEKIKQYNARHHEPFQLSISIGKAYFDSSSEMTLSELIQQADSALYLAKRLSHSK